MTKATTGCCEPPVHRLATFTARLTRTFGWLREAYRGSRQRRALLTLDAAMLKDLGISRVDALQEGHKPFWRP